MADEHTYAVLVVGAGPAGLFAARSFAAEGCRVLVLNRDIKPGGLAEYGIFLNKYKMKSGLRKQFQKVLTDPRVTYIGHVLVGDAGVLPLKDLPGLGFDAVVFATGAQGTKYLGLEGERLPGVYHAKDLVYHYNRLPPFTERAFPLGSRVAIVGIGNVMVDVANYCVHFAECEDVVAVARRGPFEKAYDDREFEDVEDAVDHDLLRQELERIRAPLAAVGQDVDVLLASLERPESSRAAEKEERPPARLRFRFLASPRRVVAEAGHVVALEVEENRLERRDDRIVAVGTGQVDRIACDSVVLAVGDCVDESMGLPYRDGMYVTAPGADGDPAAAYQVWDPAREQPMPGAFVVGWARRASEGVVGRARLDAETGVKHILAWLASRPTRPRAEVERVVESAVELLRSRGVAPVSYADVQVIEAHERARAAASHAPEYKFASDREMLDLLGD